VKESEIKKAYTRACQTRGFEPSEGQFKTWKQTLMFFEAADIERAIDLWYERETTLPMPAELKPVIEQARRERVNTGAVKKSYVAWTCDACHSSMAGFLTLEDQAPRFCRSQIVGGGVCGAEMRIAKDERLVSA
jgi:hypothetical protein